MKNKKLILIFVLLAIVGVCVIVYFITRQQQEELLAQDFAQLPEKPKLVDEFHQNTRIYSVTFSPTDSSLIALADENGTIKLWNRNITNKPAPILSHPGMFTSIKFSPTGELLASIGGGKLLLWDVGSEMKINSIEPSSRNIAFSPNGHLATVYNEVKLWDIRNPKQITEVATLPFDVKRKIRSWACAVAISPDSKLIAVGYANGSVNVWNLKTKQHVKSLKTSLSEMEFLKFSPDNKFLVCGGPQLIFKHNQYWKSRRPWGYIMWELHGWKRFGEVQRGHVENLVFSPDGKICASANDYSGYGRGVEIWSTVDGAPITTIPTEARAVSLSQDGDLIVTGGRDGIVRVWKLSPTHLDITISKNDYVRLIYNLPSGIEPSYNITQKIDKAIREVQKFYADEMERHGFGRKTFRFETDENGKAKIYRMEGYLTETHDLQLNDIWLVFADDMKDATSLLIDSLLEQDTLGQIFDSFDTKFTYPRKRKFIEKYKIWMDDTEGFTGDGRFITITKKNIDWKLTTYSLKRLFGLLGPEHSWDKYGPNMPNSILNRIDRLIPWSKDWVRLSKCEAEFLDKSRYFNPNQSFFDKRPEIEMAIIKSDTESRIFQFTATDEDGIHQLLLFVPDNLENQYRIDKFQGCETVNGKKHAIAEFEVFNSEIRRGEIRMIDMLGNIASREFKIKEKADEK